MVEFDRAPFGIVGLETARAAGLRSAGARRAHQLSRMIELLSMNPARIMSVPGGPLATGAAPTSPFSRPTRSVTDRAAALRSKSKNTPFDGWTLRGGVAATIVGGRTVYSRTA